jgi:hypothetical protein
VALAVLFLLSGILAAELALMGVDAAGMAGVALLAVAAALLLRDRDTLTHRR